MGNSTSGLPRPRNCRIQFDWLHIPCTKKACYSKRDIEDFMAIDLKNSEVAKLVRVFMKFKPIACVHPSLGSFSVIKIKNLLCGLGVVNNSLYSEIFEVKIPEVHDELTFRHFVLYLWRFLTMCDEELYNFSFNLFKTNDSNSITMAKTMESVSLLWDSKSCGTQRKLMLKIVQSEESAVFKPMELDEFIHIVKKHPALVFPVFMAQEKLRAAILGESFWLKREASAGQIKQMPHIIAMFALLREDNWSTSGGAHGSPVSMNKRLPQIQRVATATPRDSRDGNSNPTLNSGTIDLLRNPQIDCFKTKSAKIVPMTSANNNTCKDSVLYTASSEISNSEISTGRLRLSLATRRQSMK